jgi:hypothetical protein
MSISTLRNQRNALLEASDFLMLSDVPVSTAQKEAAVAYRVMLRDCIPANTTDEEAAEIDLPVPDVVIAEMLGLNTSEGE